MNPNSNFAVLAALPLAMKRGTPLHCEGDVDIDFLENIEECMAAWHRWRPDLFKPIRITASAETPPTAPRPGPAIMAFSGGLDSTFALHAHKHRLLGRRVREIDAAALIQGFDVPLTENDAFSSARRHVQAILESYGVRLNVIQTNWKDSFCVKWGMTHVFGLAAVLQLFNREFSAGIFADDTPYEHQLTPWSSNAITNQMLGSTRYPIHSTGAALDRTEKAGAVASNPVVLEHLRVCYERPELGHNCGWCEKCVRTKLNFYANGVRTVPALKAPVTPEQVRRKCNLNPRIRHLYVDTIEHGSWPPSDPVRRAVEDVLRAYDARSGLVGPSLRSQARNAIKKLRSVAYGQFQSVMRAHKS
ncbi:MAG: hypothetical protein AB7U75_10355 [Hyphomicrobiaceae bacterium]